MARVPVWQTAFNAGELSPLVLGQFELAKYKSGCKEMINANPLIQGPAQKRKGSYYTVNSKANGKFWLFEFIYDRYDTYIVEAGENYFRFFRNRAQVKTGGGAIYELATPYSYAQLTDTNDGTLNLRLVQLNDIIYVCTNDGSVPVQMLERFADNSWVITPFAPVGGPFQGLNIGTTTVYASAQTGTVTLTASASLFTASHVGMLMQLAPGTLQYVAEWEPSKQQFLGQRLRANGNTYITTSPCPVGVPKTPQSLVQALTDAVTAIFVKWPALGAIPVSSPEEDAIDLAYVNMGGTSANFAGIHTELETEHPGYGRVTSVVSYIMGLLPAWSGAAEGLYTGTIQPSHDDGVVYDGAGGSCPNPFSASPPTVPCGVPWLFEDPGYGIVQITAVTSTTVATGVVQPFRKGLVNTPTLPYYVTQSGLATRNWAFGAWGTAAGASNPTNAAFYRGRLCFSYGSGFAASVSASFDEFYTQTNGQTLADDAVATFVEEQGAIISWLLPLDALSIGTAGGELTCGEQNISNAFGPTNIKITPQTNYGSHGATPIRIGNAIFFIDSTGTVLRKIENNQQSAWTGRNSAPSQVDLADHILKPGCLQIKYAPLPFPAILATRADGLLAHFAYDKDEEIYAWSKHYLGGFQDAAIQVPAKVLCAATVPSPSGTSTDIYLGVERVVNGATMRTIEIIRDQSSAPVRGPIETKDSWLRRLNNWQCDQFHVDCGLSYDSPVVITGMTRTNPVVVTTATAHGFTNGTHVRFDGITSEAGLNARKLQVSNVTTYTFTVPYTRGTTMPAFSAVAEPGSLGAVVRQYASSVTGLTHLIGQTVKVCVDGASHPDCVVSGAGAITLAWPGSRVHVGLGYSMILDALVPPVPGQFGPTEGQTQMIDHVMVRFDNTLGGLLGYDRDNVVPINFRALSDPLGLASPAFSGVKYVELEAEWSRDRSLTFVHSDPLPATVCAMGYIIDVSEDTAH